MSKKLHYFKTNGIAESIRYILHYSGEKFEDIRYDAKSWPIKSVKDSLPYGQLPKYEEDGKTLNQSIAIARYLAAKADLLPSDPWEQAVLDSNVLNVYDFWSKIPPFIREQDATQKQALKNDILNGHIEFFFSRFDEELKKNNGHFGGKLSWADFILVGIVEAANLFLELKIEADYPTVAKLIETIRSLPGVREYIASIGPYSLAENTWTRVKQTKQ